MAITWEGEASAPEGDGLDGRVAIVTGGGSRGEGIGNGSAAAVLLARSGARVLVADRDVGAAEHTVELVTAAGGEAAAFPADVTRADDCAGMVSEAVRRWGRLDVLDNNVGIGSGRRLLDEDDETWDRLWRANVHAMVLTTRHAVPAMVESGNGGAVVNVSSISALRPRGLTAYSTTKGAVIALTKAAAVDCAPLGVRVNCVAPGPVFTPMVAAGGMTDEARERRRRVSPLGVEGTGWDVGQAVLFLASQRARWITGQVLVVDGGVTLTAAERDA
jgi:NAD(P)-dependent dehydrogenase (short-subunit alcohol dehydrogenase family)